MQGGGGGNWEGEFKKDQDLLCTYACSYEFNLCVLKICTTSKKRVTDNEHSNADLERLPRVAQHRHAWGTLSISLNPPNTCPPRDGTGPFLSRNAVPAASQGCLFLGSMFPLKSVLLRFIPDRPTQPDDRDRQDCFHATHGIFNTGCWAVFGVDQSSREGASSVCAGSPGPWQVITRCTESE